MNLQKHKNKKHNFWYSPFVLFVMFILVLVFLYNMIDIIEKLRETSKKKRNMEEKVLELKEKNDLIYQKIEKLNTQEGIEEEIREKYQFVKEGEKMVIILDKEREDKEKNDTSDESKNNIKKFISNLFQ